jgi:hypothetical protein
MEKTPMLNFRGHSTHEKYTDRYQHWCPQSAQYAGGDHLISAFRVGWTFEDNAVYAEQDWKSGSRPITVYNFVLVRDDETMIMPVISNPFIERFITERLMTIVYDSNEVQLALQD